MPCSFPSLVAASVHGALPVHYCVKHWRDRIRLSLPVVPASLPPNLLHHPLSAANPQTKARDPTGPRLTNNLINSLTTAPVSLIFVSILVKYTGSFNYPELFFLSRSLLKAFMTPLISPVSLLIYFVLCPSNNSFILLLQIKGFDH